MSPTDAGGVEQVLTSGSSLIPPSAAGTSSVRRDARAHWGAHGAPDDTVTRGRSFPSEHPATLKPPHQPFHSGEEGLPAELTGYAVDEYLAMLDDAAFGTATMHVIRRCVTSAPAA